MVLAGVRVGGDHQRSHAVFAFWSVLEKDKINDFMASKNGFLGVGA